MYKHYIATYQTRRQAKTCEIVSLLGAQLWYWLANQRKLPPTVAMDYGVIRLDEDTKVHLYGTPGQERFNFMWEILSKGSMGLILLLDNTLPTQFLRAT